MFTTGALNPKPNLKGLSTIETFGSGCTKSATLRPNNPLAPSVSDPYNCHYDAIPLPVLRLTQKIARRLEN